MRKILITGAAGFLGQLSIDYFKKRYKLYLIDKIFLKQKNFIKIDITDYNQVDKVLKKIKPDIILHYASEIFDTYKKSQININNIDGTLNLVKASKKYKIKKFIFTSTFSIFEKNYDNLINEIEPISCSNYYGLSKAETERILLSTDKNFNVTIFRCPVIVEKSRAHRLGILFEFLKENATLWVLGSGNNKIQFLSAIDLFKMTEKSFSLKGKHIFNIGTEKVLTFKETFKFLIKKTNSKSKVKHFNKFFGLLLLRILSSLRLINFIDYHNKLLVSNIVMDISRIKKVLNYNPKKSNADLLLEAYNYYIENDKKNKIGSAKKPKMGLFGLIKFISKYI
jgi:UDP-glucose 4-epimerase